MKKILLVATILLSFSLVFTACNNSSNKETTSTSKDSKETLTKDEMYTCSMHNEVMSDHEGICPKCEMKLIKQKMTAEQQKMMKEGTYTKPKE